MRETLPHTHLLNSLKGRWWVLVPAQVGQSPGHITEMLDLWQKREGEGEREKTPLNLKTL